MKSDRYLLIVTILGSIVFSTLALQWAGQGIISRTGLITFPNYSVVLLLFSSILLSGILLRLHPRYGGIYPAYRQAHEFVIFSAVLNMPVLLQIPSMAEFSDLRPDLSIIWIIFILLLYMVYTSLIPLLFQQKRYALIHYVLDVMQYMRPRNANLYIKRGQILYAQRDYEKTIEAADRAIALTPPLKKKTEEGWLSFKDWRLLYGHEIRMFAYFALDQQDMAFEDAEILVRLNPDEALAYINRSKAEARREDFAAAKADLDYASQLKLDPRRQTFLTATQASLAYLQHKNAEAQSLFQAALDIPLTPQQQRNSHPAIYSLLAMIELRAGDLVRAQEFFQKAQTINPDFKDIGIALMHAQKGEWDEAVRQWRLITAQAPHYGNIESMRRVYRSDPTFVALIEQIIAHSESAAA